MKAVTEQNIIIVVPDIVLYEKIDVLKMVRKVEKCTGLKMNSIIPLRFNWFNLDYVNIIRKCLIYRRDTVVLTGYDITKFCVNLKLSFKKKPRLERSGTKGQ